MRGKGQAEGKGKNSEWEPVFDPAKIKICGRRQRGGAQRKEFWGRMGNGAVGREPYTKKK